jgi:AraC family transcriptional regulator
MNYYQRIQKAIDYIEGHLDQPLTPELCAKEAYMSISGFYRMFLSVVGYTVKEYIRMRRLTLAYKDLLLAQESVLDIAVKYEYQSADSFTRAFKKQFGLLPSKVKSVSSQQGINEFVRLNIMEQYFENGNKALEEQYPDIKVMKDLTDLRVACFTYYGKNPENHAFAKMKQWAKKNHISFQNTSYRIFGYNHPDPSNVDDLAEIYGYEVCITISDNQFSLLHDVPEDFVKGTYDDVKRRILPGGKYAVMSVKREESGEIGNNIIAAWKRFTVWMNDSKYLWGGNQYLEEHLGFSEMDEHIGGVDLYISVKDAPKDCVLNKVEETILPCKVAIFRSEGPTRDQAATECWNKALTFAKKNLLHDTRCKLYQHHKGFDTRPPFFHVIMIPLQETFDEITYSMDSEVHFDTFTGGNYMTVSTSLDQLGESWMIMEKWRNETKAKPAKHQWLEEWELNNWDFPYKKIRVFYPIQS